MANSADTSTKFRIVAIVAAVALIAAAALTFFQGASGNPHVAGLAALSQAIPTQAADAVDGVAGGFDRLDASMKQLATLRSSAGAGAPGSSTEWQRLESRADSILAQRAAVEAVNQASAGMVEGTAAILELSNEMLDRSGATAIMQEFQQRTARVGQMAQGLAANPDAEAAAATITEHATYLRTVFEALSGENTELDVRALNAEGREVVLVPLGGLLADLGVQVEGMNGNVGQLGEVAGARAGLRSSAVSLAEAFSSGSGAGGPLPGFLQNPNIPLGLIALGILLIIGLMVLNSKSSHFETTAKVQADQNERNQQAILRLLDEMGSLADGDLTVEATVTEDITGTIADSFNFAIEELRKLVATVNETAIMVDSAAKQTESTATHMAKATDTQGREINAATESIVSMAASIEEVSGNAERSSDVARHSVEVAHKGGEAVRRTIDGMNTIRETIQETSKRIKRLGESSQEIGNIVELINDIAEQTNILALNASIQASMAGEAGRGFAVVADEVQRLAERSTNATKQIEVLVRTIQADTNEAVVSMERSTTDVVGGALLAENAGAALDEIEQVSNQIASLVQNISSSARQQAGSAADVTRRTTRLREISEQTGKATSATAVAISKLSELASQLRKTVAGFTLPTDALQAKTLQMSAANAPVAKPDGQAKAG
jgi:twitching motility protein PilJ